MQNSRFFTGTLEPGHYSFRVRANSIARYGPYTEMTVFEVKATIFPDTDNHLYAFLFLLLLLLMSLSLAISFFLARGYPDRIGNLFRNPVNFLRRLYGQIREQMREQERPEDRRNLLQNMEPALEDIPLNELGSSSGLSVIPESSDA